MVRETDFYQLSHLGLYFDNVYGIASAVLIILVGIAIGACGHYSQRLGADHWTVGVAATAGTFLLLGFLVCLFTALDIVEPVSAVGHSNRWMIGLVGMFFAFAFFSKTLTEGFLGRQ